MAPSAVGVFSNGHSNDNLRDETSSSIIVTKNGHKGNTYDADTSSFLRNNGTVDSQSTIRTEHRTSQHENHPDRSSSYASKFSYTSNQQITEFLAQTIATTRTKFISDIGHVDGHYIDSMSLEGLLDYIELERLTNMPQRGSRWDKVLKWAEFFAVQISGYEKTVQSFVPESKTAAKLIWTSCRILIELGPNNAQAVETAFETFYKIGLSLSFFLRHHELLSANSRIRSDVGQAFDALLALVREVCLYYNIRINGLSESVSVDFGATFGKRIQAFYRRKDHIIEGMWKSKTQDASDIGLVRQWLNIQDKTTRAIIRDRVSAATRRDEYTCDWFQRHLLDFSRGKHDVLAVVGPTGSGKTFLSRWIVERLQRPLDKRIYETLTYTIDTEMPQETTPIAVAKSLAVQLLELNIGDVSLLKALAKARDLSFRSTDVQVLDNALWAALDAGMNTFKFTNLVILIDGLGDFDGHDKNNSVGKRIAALAFKHSNVQAILFSRKAAHLEKQKYLLLEVTPELTHNDIRHITEHALASHPHFEDQSDHDKESIVEQLSHSANGNFLWILLASILLKQETSHDGFTKAVKGLKDGPKSLHDVIAKVATLVDLNNSNTKLLLSWLLVAKRPLRVEEVRSLLRVDLQQKLLLSRKENIEKEIANAFGPLVVVRNGIVSFRHEAVKTYFAELQAAATSLPSIKAAQADLTTRLLAYGKFRPLDDSHPSFEGLSKDEADRLFQNDQLVEYALRYWIFHFQESSFYKDASVFEFSPEFKSIFPHYVQYPILEAHCWDTEHSYQEAVHMHKLALLIRQNTLTEQHPSVLQTWINHGSLLRKAGDTNEAANSFYQASLISRSILESYNSLTIRCVTIFLEISDSHKTTSRDEVITRREELLKYIIEASRHRYGNSSDLVIRYLETLAELYESIHEDSYAEIIWRELREIMIARHGKGSEQETSISDHLDVVLNRDHKQEEITEYEREVLAKSTDTEVWDIRSIKVTLDLAILYEGQGNLFEAEELYITLWSRIIEHCHGIHHHGFGQDIHISMIDIAVTYVEFLRRSHRDEEAGGILICIWNEYAEYDFDYELIFLRLKAVGELMRAINLFSIAISVFRKCFTWFRAHNKYEYAESCETLISKTTAEIIKTTRSTSSSASTTTTATTLTSSTTETVIKESFESVISRSKVTMETISVCSSLITYYVEHQQWSKAIEVSKRSLEVIWRMVITGGTLALPREFGSEAIDIALRLANYHNRSHHFHEAEEIYLRVYRACWNSCHFEDKRLTRAYTALIKFYEEHQHWSQVIEIYQELLLTSRKQLGISHAVTVKFLYALGTISTKHGHPHAHKYYEEIVTLLNIHGNMCHKESVRALIVLSKYYFEAGLWQQLQSTCSLLWETWIHRHHEYDFEADFIELLYARYVYVLEHHNHATHELIRTITIQYRETSVTVFGASAAVSVRALVELAEVCLRAEYFHEAISHYEEVIQITKISSTTSKSSETSTTTTSTISISFIEQKLSSAYIQVCSHGLVTSTTVEKATQVLTHRFEHLKVTLGFSHTETLTVLRELLLLQCKFVTEELRLKIIKTLTEITVTILAKEKHSEALYEAAKILGGIYVSCGLIEEGRKTLRELRGQIICKTHSKDQLFGFQVATSVGKASYVFLVSFEEVLQGWLASSYSKLMADLLTEAFLYESYRRSLKAHKFEETLIAGARLYVFLFSLSRTVEVLSLQGELHKAFTNTWGSILKSPTEITTLFLVTLLRELGKDTCKPHTENAACVATNEKVRELLEQGSFKEAFELAQCAFRFFDHEGTYHQIQNVGYGFKLSGYMASRGLRRTSENLIDPKLHASMLELSRTIIREVLKACKHEKINFVQLKIGEINDLVGLLGKQENYSDLEWLLKSLWSSREVQRSWSSGTITAIGKCLVQALFLLECNKDKGTADYSKAFSLGEAICYNLRRVGGGLSPKALAISDLLSQMYTTTGHFREAMAVHEEILRLVVEGDDGDDRTPDTVQPQMARHHLDMLKRCYQRLGGWDKKTSVYKELVDRLLNMPEYKHNPAFKDVQGIEKWEAKVKNDDGLGHFEVPKTWEFIDPNSLDEKGDLIDLRHLISSPSSTMKRVTSDWGMGSLHENLFGPQSNHEDSPVFSPVEQYRPTLVGDTVK